MGNRNNINTRGKKWAEANGKRADGQFGFRENRSTLDDTFVLRHTVERYSALKKPVFCAFIDFTKALRSSTGGFVCLHRFYKDSTQLYGWPCVFS